MRISSEAQMLGGPYFMKGKVSKDMSLPQEERTFDTIIQTAARLEELSKGILQIIEVCEQISMNEPLRSINSCNAINIRNRNIEVFIQRTMCLQWFPLVASGPGINVGLDRDAKSSIKLLQLQLGVLSIVTVYTY